MATFQIEFLNPEYAGQTGTQEITDDTREVVAVRFADGTEVPNDPPYSYRLVDA